MNEDAQTDIVMPGSKAETIIEDGDLATDVEVKEEAKEVISESSPDTGENQEEKTSGVQKRINDLTARRYAAERENEQLKQKLAKAETQKPVIQQEVLNAPSLPEDTYDQEAMQKYHKDMVAYSTQVAQQAARQTFEESQKSVQQSAQQKQAQDMLSSYAQNAIKDGVDMDDYLRGYEDALKDKKEQRTDKGDNNAR